MDRKSPIRVILPREKRLLFFSLLSPMFTKTRYNKVYADITANMLIDMGFENIVQSEDEEEKVYVLENTPWRLQGVGLVHAIDRIQKAGLSEKDKSCRIIVLDNSTLQISLIYTVNPGSLKATPSPYTTRSAWDVIYDLDDSRDRVNKEYRMNSSLFKVDVAVYPGLYLKNLVITQIYQMLFSLSPVIEVSLWNGIRLMVQVTFPIYNDRYGPWVGKAHPGMAILSQSLRLPYRTFARASIDSFNADRYGVGLAVTHHLKDEHSSLEGRIGYAGVGPWQKFGHYYRTHQRMTWLLGGGFYWPKYNAQVSLKVERYSLGEVEGRIDLIRHLCYCSIGFYATKAQGTLKSGGFRFQVAFPPYKYKRKSTRALPSDDQGMSYSAGSECYCCKEYRALPNDSIMQRSQFNSYLAKSGLLNF